jgi:hypothetical protein
VKVYKQQILFLIPILFFSSCTQNDSDKIQIAQTMDRITKTEQPPKLMASPTSTLIPSQTSSPKPTATPISTDFPTPIPIDPSRYESWWTYTHPNYGFSLRLPNDWAITETTTGKSQLNGHLLNIHPHNTGESIDIRVTFRKVGDEVLLWPTGVGSGEFVSYGLIEIAGKPARRMLFVCPTGQIQSIWYQGETKPHILRGDLEFGFIFQFSRIYCQEGYSLSGKVQHIGEMIIASLQVP